MLSWVNGNCNFAVWHVPVYVVCGMVVEEYYFISVKAVFLNTYIISHTYAYIRYGSRPTTLPVVRCKTTTCQRRITYCLRTSANNAASAELLDEGTGQLSSLPALFFLYRTHQQYHSDVLGCAALLLVKAVLEEHHHHYYRNKCKHTHTFTTDCSIAKAITACAGRNRLLIELHVNAVINVWCGKDGLSAVVSLLPYADRKPMFSRWLRVSARRTEGKTRQDSHSTTACNANVDYILMKLHFCKQSAQSRTMT